MKVMTIAVMVLRIAVLVALVMGIIFWTGNLENLQLVHMLIGFIVVLSLWVIGLAQGFIKGGSFGLAVIHLLLGLSAIGLGEMIYARTRKRLKTTVAA